VLAIQERARIEHVLEATQHELLASRQENEGLKLEVQQLQESVEQLLKSHKALVSERDQLAQQCSKLQHRTRLSPQAGTGRDHLVAALQGQLAAAMRELQELRAPQQLISAGSAGGHHGGVSCAGR
jgi:predicted nuclease with TOPRIM domain